MFLRHRGVARCANTPCGVTGRVASIEARGTDEKLGNYLAPPANPCTSVNLRVAGAHTRFRLHKCLQLATCSRLRVCRSTSDNVLAAAVVAASASALLRCRCPPSTLRTAHGPESHPPLRELSLLTTPRCLWAWRSPPLSPLPLPPRPSPPPPSPSIASASMA